VVVLIHDTRNCEGVEVGGGIIAVAAAGREPRLRADSCTNGLCGGWDTLRCC
jgi:hypothetical protein